MCTLTHLSTYIQLKLAMEANRQARLQLAEKRGDTRTQDRGALAFDIDLSSTEKPNSNGAFGGGQGGGHNYDPKSRRHVASSPQLSSVPTIREEHSNGAGSDDRVGRGDEKVGGEGDGDVSEATIKRVNDRRGAGGGRWGEPTDLSDLQKLPTNTKTSSRNTPSDTPLVSSTGRNILHSSPALLSPAKQAITAATAAAAEAKESQGWTERSPDPPPYNTSTPSTTVYYTAESKDNTNNLTAKGHNSDLPSSNLNANTTTAENDDDDASVVLLKLQSNERYQEDIRRRAKETFQKRRLEKKNKGNANNRENKGTEDSSTSSGSGKNTTAGSSGNSNSYFIQPSSSQAMAPTTSAQPSVKQASPNPSPSEIMTGNKGSKLSSVLESVASAVQIVNNTVEGHRQGPTSSPVPTTTSTTTAYTKTNINTSSSFTSTTTTHASAEARKPNLNLTLDETLDRWFIRSTAAETHPTSTPVPTTIPTVPTPSILQSHNTLASKATHDESDRYAKEEAKITLQIQARKGNNTTTTTPNTTNSTNDSNYSNVKSPPYVNYSKENTLETNKDKELSGLQCVLANELMSDDSQ